MTINIDLLAGLADAQRDAYPTPSNGQTVFPLTRTPHDTTDVRFLVNSAEYTEGVSGGGYFTVSGTTLTWAGLFAIQNTDLIEAVYYPRYGA
jgi:hypothetical protein